MTNVLGSLATDTHRQTLQSESNEAKVLHLSKFVKSLPRESELRDKYAELAEYRMQWLLPVGAGVAGVVALVSGAMVAGIVLVFGGGGLGFWLPRRAQAAEDARALWSWSWNCRRCPALFPRDDAIAV